MAFANNFPTLYVPGGWVPVYCYLISRLATPLCRDPYRDSCGGAHGHRSFGCFLITATVLTIIDVTQSSISALGGIIAPTGKLRKSHYLLEQNNIHSRYNYCFVRRERITLKAELSEYHFPFPTCGNNSHVEVFIGNICTLFGSSTSNKRLYLA